MFRLKSLQMKYNIVVFALSSINRANYLTPIDCESFKESGNIEFSTDVLLGMQLDVFNDDIFLNADNFKSRVAQKRALINKAKSANPRDIEIVCLKNRFGTTGNRIHFQYDTEVDRFTADIEDCCEFT